MNTQYPARILYGAEKLSFGERLRLLLGWNLLVRIESSDGSFDPETCTLAVTTVRGRIDDDGEVSSEAIAPPPTMTFTAAEHVTHGNLTEAMEAVGRFRADLAHMGDFAAEYAAVGADTEEFVSAITDTRDALAQVEVTLRAVIDQFLDGTGDGQTPDLDRAMERLRASRTALFEALRDIAPPSSDAN